VASELNEVPKIKECEYTCGCSVRYLVLLKIRIKHVKRDRKITACVFMLIGAFTGNNENVQTVRTMRQE